MNPYIPPGGQSAGMLRYNTNMNMVEVYDGQVWKEVSSYANVALTMEAEVLLDWARRKRDEESQFEALAKEHPAIKAAYENLKRAETQLKTTIILSEDEKTTS